MASEKVQLRQLIGDLEQLRDRRLIVYWLPDVARVSDAVIPSLYDQLLEIGKQSSLDLMLFTRGGDTEAPWRIVTLIREFCDSFGVLVPYRAHSAGTMLAMGADEIVMAPLGVLSPIDPSRTHPLLPRREGSTEAEPISVQDMRHAMRFITDTAMPGEEASYTPEAMAQIVTALFDKIHPLAIGAIEQSYALAKLIGARCLATHMDPEKESGEIESIVNTLCDDYKSHAYPIARREAREIGLKVVDPSPEEDAAMTALLKFYLGRPVGGPSSPTDAKPFKMIIGWMDSLDMHIRCEANARVGQGKVEFMGDQWTAY